MAGVAPLLARFDHDDFAGKDCPEAAGAERDDPLAPEQPAARGRLLDRQGGQLDGTAQVEVGRIGLAAGLASSGGGFRWVGCKSHPLAVRGKVARTFRARRDHHLGSRHDVFGTIHPAAPCGQPAPLVSIVVELDHRDRLADNGGLARHGNVVLAGLLKSSDPLVFAACLGRELVDEFVQRGHIQAVAVLLPHESSLPCRPPQRALARSRKDGWSPRPEPAARTSNPDMKPVLRWWQARTRRTVSSHSAARPTRS